MPNLTAEKRRINRHITKLNSPDENVSRRAEDYLMRCYGSRALLPLLEACHHTNPVVRFRAVWVLGYTHDSRAYETILRLTDDPDERVRYDATIALGILGDDRALESLKQITLCNDERNIVLAFLRMGIKTVPVLTELLHQDNAEIRWAVTQVLGNFAQDFGDQRSLGLLQEAANDPDSSVRENVECWLKDISEIDPHNTERKEG